jgi:hypothetical protein
MILAFQPQFVPKILAGTKIHTIRQDAPNRWRAGRTIQMATGVRTKDYNCFKNTVCIGTQSISITHTTYSPDIQSFAVMIDGLSLTGEQIHALAIADGFDNITQFQNYFNTNFTGKIIHWLNIKY